MLLLVLVGEVADVLDGRGGEVIDESSAIRRRVVVLEKDLASDVGDLDGRVVHHVAVLPLAPLLVERRGDVRKVGVGAVLAVDGGRVRCFAVGRFRLGRLGIVG